MILRWFKSVFAQLHLDKVKAELSGNESSVSFEGNTGRSDPMWLFVGLGNPGKKYAQNRHNVGFMMIDRIADAAGLSNNFRKKYNGEFSEGAISGEKIILLKPQTYMNNSGQSVSAAAQFYKIDPSHVVVFHDEIDIDPGVVRIKLGGGNAGHNGLKSVQAHMGSPDFWRVRIGIGRSVHGKEVSDYVLEDFSRDEVVWLSPLLSEMSERITLFFKNSPKAYEKKISEHFQKI